MSFNDTIADMLTRIRNALRVRAPRVDCRNSKICQGIARVLKEEGYINDFHVLEDGRQGILRIELRYGPNGELVMTNLRRTSKPGRRIYVGVANMPRPMSGLGIAILSTSRGVMSDRQARAQRVGGELLCIVE